ncbi:hypothetical protein [Aquimarina aquimarini]|uniref:hypothetical protein n=1 Tax=Aquimarina aquimarini TaxID=1191734 RepID=UPI001F4676C8|nr:hypothetical protein [Aquimarina aquimarini]
MKTKTQSALRNNRVAIFEQKVCELLSVKPTVFNTYVKEHKGYAYLLRAWIQEMYYNGKTPSEVATIIKKSNLRIEAIKVGEPLYMTG